MKFLRLERKFRLVGSGDSKVDRLAGAEGLRPLMQWLGVDTCLQWQWVVFEGFVTRKVMRAQAALAVWG